MNDKNYSDWKIDDTRDWDLDIEKEMRMYLLHRAHTSQQANWEFLKSVDHKPEVIEMRAQMEKEMVYLKKWFEEVKQEQT